MLNIDDKFWQELTGPYKTPLDPRPLLTRLEGGEATMIWPELWNELHHQGDVGTASYAAVPQLVRIYRQLGIIDWNVYAIVAVIELARDRPQNPKVPKLFERDYFRAIHELARIGEGELGRTEDPETVRAILSVIAISKGLRVHGRFMIAFSEDELLEMDPLG